MRCDQFVPRPPGAMAAARAKKLRDVLDENQRDGALGAIVSRTDGQLSEPATGGSSESTLERAQESHRGARGDVAVARAAGGIVELRRPPRARVRGRSPGRPPGVRTGSWRRRRSSRAGARTRAPSPPATRRRPLTAVSRCENPRASCSHDRAADSPRASGTRADARKTTTPDAREASRDATRVSPPRRLPASPPRRRYALPYGHAVLKPTRLRPPRGLRPPRTPTHPDGQRLRASAPSSTPSAATPRTPSRQRAARAPGDPDARQRCRREIVTRRTRRDAATRSERT